MHNILCISLLLKKMSLEAKHCQCFIFKLPMNVLFTIEVIQEMKILNQEGKVDFFGVSFAFEF